MNEKYIEKIAELQVQSDAHTKRLDEHSKAIKELSNVYVALTQVDDKVENVKSDVCEIKSDIKEIKDKPSKRMDAIVGYILSAIIGAIITFLAVKLGLK